MDFVHLPPSTFVKHHDMWRFSITLNSLCGLCHINWALSHFVNHGKSRKVVGGRQWSTVMPLSTCWKVSDQWVERSVYRKWIKREKNGSCWTFSCAKLRPPRRLLPTMLSCQMSRQEMTAPWAERDILQSRWMCDMQRMWCHMLENNCACRCACVHACWYTCTFVHWDKRENSSKQFILKQFKSFMLQLFWRKTGVKLPAWTDFSTVSFNNPLHSEKPHQISCALTPGSGDISHSCHC